MTATPPPVPHDYRFYPDLRFVGEFHMEHKPKSDGTPNKADGSFEEHMYFERWSPHLVRVQLLASAALEYEQLVRDERLLEFVSKHWQQLYVPHEDIGCRPTSFQGFSSEVDSEPEPRKGERIREPDIIELNSHDIAAQIADGALAAQLKPLGYDDSMPLLVLPLLAFVLPARRVAAIASASSATTTTPTTTTTKRKSPEPAEAPEEGEVIDLTADAMAAVVDVEPKRAKTEPETEEK